MEPVRETTTEGGFGSVSVSNVLSGSGAVGAGGATIWVRYLGFFGGNVQEGGGGARAVPQTCDGENVQAADRWDLNKRDSGECNQRSGYTDTGDIQ